MTKMRPSKHFLRPRKRTDFVPFSCLSKRMRGDLKSCVLCLSGVFSLIFGCGLSPAFSGDLPSKGAFLPDFQLEAPASEQERRYLGIGPSPSFSIGQVEGRLFMVEIVGVYCPQCHIQFPRFNNLYHRIMKDPELKGKVKVFAVAVGANPTEIAYLKKESHIPYPVLQDPAFKIHKLLGEPRTPFTMLVNKNREVLFAHLGTMEDMDALYLKIRSLTK